MRGAFRLVAEQHLDARTPAAVAFLGDAGNLAAISNASSLIVQSSSIAY